MSRNPVAGASPPGRIGCGSSSPSPPASTAAFGKSLDALCAAETAATRSLEASQQLPLAQLEAKSKAVGAAFRAGVARLTPPASLAGPLRTLTQGQASPPDSPGPPSAASVGALVTYERKLASDYTALGATSCAAREQGSAASLECSLSHPVTTCPADPSRVMIVVQGKATGTP
jgi:hypothetical protein